MTKDFKKDSIQDFCYAWQKYDQARLDNILHRHWDNRFRDAGYYAVALDAKSNRGRSELHRWCVEHVGEQHYAWTGTSTFWFETEQAAVWFALKFA